MVPVFVKNKDFLVTGNNDGIITIWELVVNEENQAKPCLIGVINNTQNPYEDMNTGPEVLAVAYNPINNTILAGGSNQNIIIWDFYTRQFIGALTGHKGAVTCLALDKNILFSGSEDLTVMVWDTHNKLLLNTLTGHTGPLQDVLILEETGLLVTCAEDKKIAVWDYQNAKVLKIIQKGDYFKTLDYINSLKILIGGNMDKTIYSFQIPEYLDKSKWREGGNMEERKVSDEKNEEDEEEEEKTFVVEEKEKKMEEEIVTLLKDVKQLLND